MNKVVERPVVKDPDELLESLGELLRAAAARPGVERLELYHRCSTGLRVALDSSRGRHTSHRTDDEGIAVRAQRSGPDGACFGASTGSGPEVVSWVLDHALEGGSTEPWPREPAADLEDRDRGELPALDEVENWLQRAWGGLSAASGGPSPWQEGVARVEVARIVESWVSDAGLRASRVRIRAWAVAQTRRSSAASMLRRPLFVASRGWKGLDERRWAELWRARGPSGGPASGPTRRRALSLTPEASGELVLALSRVLRVGERVGPGWRLGDEPHHDNAAYGGSFDDAGFPTATRELADGRTVLASIDGPGHLRRASYRDPPRPWHSRLAVENLDVSPPPRALRVSSLVIHPGGPNDWTVEVAGPELAHGLFRTAPSELARRCAGATGGRITDHRGVATSSLLFEDLEVEPLQA